MSQDIKQNQPQRLTTNQFARELENKCWDICHHIRQLSYSDRSEFTAFYLEGMACALKAIQKYEEVE